MEALNPRRRAGAPAPGPMSESETVMKQCEQIQQQIVAGSPAADSASHLESCAACREVAEAAAVLSSFRGAPSAELDAKVMADYRRIVQPSGERQVVLSFWLRRYGWIAGAAGFLVLLAPFYGNLFHGQPPKATVEPAPVPRSAVAEDDVNFVIDQYDQGDAVVDQLVEAESADPQEPMGDEEGEVAG